MTQTTIQSSVDSMDGVRPSVGGSLGKPFAQLAERLALGLPFQQTTPGHSHKAIISAFGGSRQALQRIHRELLTVCRAALAVNVRVETDRSNEPQWRRLKQRGIDDMLALSPGWEFALDDGALSLERVGRPSPVLWAELGAALWSDTQRLVEEFARHLEELVECNLFGRHTWTAPHVGHYHFYRMGYSLERRDSRAWEQVERHEFRDPTKVGKVPVTGHYEETTTRGVTHRNRLALVYERHDHEVYDAREYSWTAREIPQPRWVCEFLAQIPAVLRPTVTVVAGEMSRETVKRYQKYERDLLETEILDVVRREGDLYSPAVLIGSVALVGWSGADLVRDPSKTCRFRC